MKSYENIFNVKQIIRKFSGIICFISFLMVISGFVGTVSAVDLVVNSSTTSNDIDSWIKNNNTVKGDNLIFNVTTYNLNDTLIVSKPITIKSNIKTKINFNKNKHMFYINSREVNFSGLTLEHSGKATAEFVYSIIFANSSSTIHANFKDMKFILNNKYLGAIAIKSLIGDINNSNIIGKKSFNVGVACNNWTGNVFKSFITMEKDSSFPLMILEAYRGNISQSKIMLKSSQSYALVTGIWVGNFLNSDIGASGSGTIGIIAEKWTGNSSFSKFILKDSKSFAIMINKTWIGDFLNSGISTSGSESFGIFAEKWTGKMSASKISTNGKDSVGIYSNSSTKATIHNNTIHAKKGFAVMVSKHVKVTSSSLISNKNHPKIYVFGPRIELDKISSENNSKNYFFRINNIGEFKSTTSFLIITTKGYKKTVKIKSIKAEKYIDIKVVLPKKYSTEKSLKKARILYIDGYGKKVYTDYLEFKS